VPRPAIRGQNGNRHAGLLASRSIELDHYDIAEAMSEALGQDHLFANVDRRVPQRQLQTNIDFRHS
jgi:hypothetical protein